jgi:hypothetical protein
MRDGMTGGCSRRHHVHSVTIRIVAAAIVLAGCTAEDASPPPAVSQSPAPGTVNVHLNGRVEVDLGTSTR